MKRYNQVRDGSYEPRSEMVEERDGDWVWWDDLDELLESATDVIARWDGPDWKWDEYTAILIDRLRAAIAKAKGEGV